MVLPTAALGVAGVAAAGAWFFPFLVATLAYYHHASNDPERRPINKEELYKEYDFIIIGEINIFQTRTSCLSRQQQAGLRQKHGMLIFILQLISDLLTGHTTCGMWRRRDAWKCAVDD
jgi:hypothetical protein